MDAARYHSSLPGLVAVLGAMPWVERVVLFGSRARGDERRRSDIDLAVAAPEADIRQWTEIADAVAEAETLLHVDLVRLEEAAPRLRDEIASEGVVLYDRQAAAAKSA